MSLRESAGRTAAASAPVNPELRRIASRQRWGVRNRRLGWVILPIVVVASVVHYAMGGDHGTRNEFVLVLQFTFVPMAVVHAGLSFYVFGWVPPSRTLKVFHVWFGYSYAVLVVASQTSWSLPVLHHVLTTAMFAALTAHVAIGIRFARRRRSAGLSPRASSYSDPVARDASGR